MKIRRKLVHGALAFAFLVPAGFVAALEGPSLLAGAAGPSFPVVCNMSATVTFSPPLTLAGTDTTNPAAVTTTTISGVTLSNCLSSDPSGPPTSGSATVSPITTATSGSSTPTKGIE